MKIKAKDIKAGLMLAHGLNSPLVVIADVGGEGFTLLDQGSYLFADRLGSAKELAKFLTADGYEII